MNDERISHYIALIVVGTLALILVIIVVSAIVVIGVVPGDHHEAASALDNAFIAIIGCFVGILGSLGARLLGTVKPVEKEPPPP